MTGRALVRRWNRASPFYTRIVVLGAVMLAMLAAIALLTHRAWRRASAARGEAQQVRRVSAWLGDEIREAVHALDTRMLRFKLGADPAEWRDFQAEITEFRAWLNDQRPYLVTSEERALFVRFDHELENYEAAARLFATPLPLSPPESELAVQVTELTHRSKGLIELGFELASAHQATVDDVLADADRESAQTQWTTFAAVGMLLCLSSGMGWIVYRDSIAPLRRRLLESRRQLERHQKLAALGELSALIAHEVRNPLTAIKARLYTLRKLLPDLPEAADDACVIDEEIDRLERIVREFLQFARPAEPRLGPVDPLALLRRVRDLMAPTWSARGVRFELEEAPVPEIAADHDQLEQALLNLAQNAAQAIAESGRDGVVRLSARPRARPLRGAPGTGAGVQFEVRDDGPGIPADVQRRLFDPFFTTKPSGTGLGLALTARVVEQHGGRITFQSAPGAGASFTVILPRRPAARPRDP